MECLDNNCQESLQSPYLWWCGLLSVVISGAAVLFGLLSKTQIDDRAKAQIFKGSLLLIIGLLFYFVAPKVLQWILAFPRIKTYYESAYAIIYKLFETNIFVQASFMMVPTYFLHSFRDTIYYYTILPLMLWSEFKYDLSINSQDPHINSIIEYLTERIESEDREKFISSQKSLKASIKVKKMSHKERMQSWFSNINTEGPEYQYTPANHAQSLSFNFDFENKTHKIYVGLTETEPYYPAGHDEPVVLKSVKLEVFSFSFFGVGGLKNGDILKRVVEEAINTKVTKPQQNKLNVLILKVIWRDPIWSRIEPSKDRRTADSVVLDGNTMQDILDDIKTFFDPKTVNFYAKNGIPYRRGYLLYGPPGCGKTSFAMVIASHFNLDICMLNLEGGNIEDNNLAEALRDAPARSILLLEDVDAIFHGRDSAQQEGGGRGGGGGNKRSSSVSFSGLLNAIDGVVAQEGRILIMTTNHREKLDPALIRPGRCDMELMVKKASKDQIKNMYIRFYKHLIQEYENIAFVTSADNSSKIIGVIDVLDIATELCNSDQCVIGRKKHDDDLKVFLSFKLTSPVYTDENASVFEVICQMAWNDVQTVIVKYSKSKFGIITSFDVMNWIYRESILEGKDFSKLKTVLIKNYLESQNYCLDSRVRESKDMLTLFADAQDSNLDFVYGNLVDVEMMQDEKSIKEIINFFVTDMRTRHIPVLDKNHSLIGFLDIIKVLHDSNTNAKIAAKAIGSKLQQQSSLLVNMDASPPIPVIDMFKKEYQEVFTGRGIVVVGNNKNVVGVITVRNLLNEVITHSSSLTNTLVKDVMTKLSSDEMSLNKTFVLPTVKEGDLVSMDVCSALDNFFEVMTNQEQRPDTVTEKRLAENGDIFASRIPEYEISMAQLQCYLLQYRSKSGMKDALNNVIKLYAPKKDVQKVLSTSEYLENLNLDFYVPVFESFGLFTSNSFKDYFSDEKRKKIELPTNIQTTNVDLCYDYNSIVSAKSLLSKDSLIMDKTNLADLAYMRRSFLDQFAAFPDKFNGGGKVSIPSSRSSLSQVGVSASKLERQSSVNSFFNDDSVDKHKMSISDKFCECLTITESTTEKDVDISSDPLTQKGATNMKTRKDAVTSTIISAYNFDGLLECHKLVSNNLTDEEMEVVIMNCLKFAEDYKTLKSLKKFHRSPEILMQSMSAVDFLRRAGLYEKIAYFKKAFGKDIDSKVPAKDLIAFLKSNKEDEVKDDAFKKPYNLSDAEAERLANILNLKDKFAKDLSNPMKDFALTPLISIREEFTKYFCNLPTYETPATLETISNQSTYSSVEYAGYVFAVECCKRFYSNPGSELRRERALPDNIPNPIYLASSQIGAGVEASTSPRSMKRGDNAVFAADRLSTVASKSRDYLHSTTSSLSTIELRQYFKEHKTIAAACKEENIRKFIDELPKPEELKVEEVKEEKKVSTWVGKWLTAIFEVEKESKSSSATEVSPTATSTSTSTLSVDHPSILAGSPPSTLSSLSGSPIEKEHEEQKKDTSSASITSTTSVATGDSSSSLSAIVKDRNPHKHESNFTIEGFETRSDLIHCLLFTHDMLKAMGIEKLGERMKIIYWHDKLLKNNTEPPNLNL